MSSLEKKSLLLKDPALSADAVERHFARMDSDYWNEFSAPDIAAHLKALESLTPAAPWRVHVERLDEGLSGLTLIGGDFQGFFAAVSGFLASTGYDIRAGKAFTFKGDGAAARLDALPRGGLIDFLVLRHEDPARDTDEERARLRGEMEDLFRRFGAGESAAIRVELYRRIGARLESRNGLAASTVPLEVRVHVVNNATRLSIRARDREGMLFCIAGALSLQGLSLVTLVTAAHDDGFFENTLTVTGPGGQPVREPRELEKIRTGIALMERLLQSLPDAVNLQAAAEGLQALVDDWLEESSDLAAAGGERESLNVLPALSRVLTAGPYLWEAVDRRGPRAFRELLAELSREVAIPDRATHATALAGLPPDDREALRAYRDREILKAELDLLLTPARDWNGFSERLTALAEATLAFAVEAVRGGLVARHGAPCPYALFALGKFGGEELGSGSDLEVVLVHAGAGETSGPEPLRCGEFYERLVRELVRWWGVPQGETFALDLRLRPHGESGPLASGRESWTAYYQRGGAALDYERQALIRLRPLETGAGGNDPTLVATLLAARDEVLYGGPPLPIDETRALFAKQAAHKEKPGTWNAKYSRGGLGELEYGIQFLQLKHGAARPGVRQHQWTRALEALLEAGVLSLAEFEHLYGANLFLRRLINALRLVHGQARDLYCPPVHSAEFSFLAKRLGYSARYAARGGDDQRAASAEALLDRDLKRAQNVVAGFFRYRFLEGPRPEWLYDSLAETLMDPGATLAEAAPALERLGMTDLPRARRLFADLFDLLVEKRLAAACLLTFEGHFRRSPDPEGVLQHLVRYLGALPHPDVFIRQALHHPPLLEMLLLVFANSDPLSDLTVREGDAFKALIESGSLEQPRLPAEFLRLADAALEDASFGEEAATRLCRLRNREYLRIALRDLHLNIPLREITYEISGLTDALLRTGLRQAFEAAGYADLLPHFSVLALGKLGGSELNYSSDIDLVFVMSDEAAQGGRRGDTERAARAFITLLTRDTPEGRLFRVDMNLRPWGGQGPLVGSVSQYQEYFHGLADGWEMQAWIKARTVCGPAVVGDAVVAEAQRQASAPENAERVVASMRKVRLLGLDKLHRGDQLAGEVKLGPGGIRTVEFYTQSLQIRHAAAMPELLTGNTLEALGRLTRYGLLPAGRFRLLTEAYVFLRRVEHRLQLQGLQQRHALPSGEAELGRLARQMGFEDRVGQPARLQFLEQYRKHVLSLQPVSAELFDH
jgi:glutamate-ammonia-ligase adenylyltransferase